MADNDNPGNFANRPKEEVQAIASKGGKASHGGGGGGSGGSAETNPGNFANRPKEEVRAIASKGGKASHGGGRGGGNNGTIGDTDEVDDADGLDDVSIMGFAASLYYTVLTLFNVIGDSRFQGRTQSRRNFQEGECGGQRGWPQGRVKVRAALCVCMSSCWVSTDCTSEMIA